MHGHGRGSAALALGGSQNECTAVGQWRRSHTVLPHTFVLARPPSASAGVPTASVRHLFEFVTDPAINEGNIEQCRERLWELADEREESADTPSAGEEGIQAEIFRHSFIPRRLDEVRSRRPCCDELRISPLRCPFLVTLMLMLLRPRCIWQRRVGGTSGSCSFLEPYSDRLERHPGAHCSSPDRVSSHLVHRSQPPSLLR